MSRAARLIQYPEDRALEDAAFSHGMVPRRIFALLLPVWRVEISATITESEPYDLIDRYLERGIAETGLTTADDLSRFFGLDHVVVDRALRFLTAVGHVVEVDGRLSLAPLGQASLRDQVRYSVRRGDRRKLYFDAFGSRPLTRPYYESRTVTLLEPDELATATAGNGEPRFQALSVTRGFRREALAELAANPARDRFNLPERIDDPQSLGEDLVHLPAYVVLAGSRDGRSRLLAYTQVGRGADEDVSQLLEHTPEIVEVLATEDRGGRSALEERRAMRWLEGRGLGRHRPVRLDDGTWQVTVPASAFGRDGKVAITKVGAFVVLGNSFFRLWCEDPGVRRRSLLARADSYLGARSRIARVEADAWIEQVARQLDLGPVDVPTLGQMARDGGKAGLAAQLDRLS